MIRLSKLIMREIAVVQAPQQRAMVQDGQGEVAKALLGSCHPKRAARAFNRHLPLQKYVGGGTRHGRSIAALI